MIEFIGLTLAILQDHRKLRAKWSGERVVITQAQADGFGFSRTDVQDIVGCGFGARLMGMNGLFAPMDNILLKGIFDIGRSIRSPPETYVVRFVFVTL